MNRLPGKLMITALTLALLVGCESSGTSSVHTSYSVHYRHGYGYPGYYPRGRYGPPVIVRPPARPPVHLPAPRR